ncbi:MAG: twin-arginine translocase subunit TatC [Anaerolineales bacterium]|jgi:sec-independent protein translocase protein TatC|nr:twin-arginine translocase subunit TatC [Anaerolineales bacterium]
MIRRFFAFLWRLLTFPFRLVARPFRALASAISQEPEDTPAVEAFSRTLENPFLLLEHLEALRGHLLRLVAALALTTAVGFAFAARVLDWLARPIGGIQSLQAIEVTESVSAFMRVSLLTGFVLAFPYICLELFLFIAPGLKRRERFLVLTTIPVAFVLFVAGLSFAYYVMLPVALPFLLNFMGITTVPRPANYIRFVTGLLFWIGMSFQFPLIIYAMAALGMVRARMLVEGWRIAIVIIAVVAAAVTPTVDPVNMGLVMAPMILLYFFSIGLAAFAERTRTRRIEKESG